MYVWHDTVDVVEQVHCPANKTKLLLPASAVYVIELVPSVSASGLVGPTLCTTTTVESSHSHDVMSCHLIIQYNVSCRGIEWYEGAEVE